MDVVRDRAQGLPVDDAPPEIIRMLPFDGAHEKLQPNKNATPVAGFKADEDMAEHLDTLRFNAVVCERSSHDQYDKIAQDRSCVEHTVRMLKDVINLDSDEASADGQEDETSNDESAGEETVRFDNASECGGNGVSNKNDEKTKDFERR